MLVMLILIWSTDGSNDNVTLVLSLKIVKPKFLEIWLNFLNANAIVIFDMFVPDHACTKPASNTQYQFIYSTLK